MKLYIKQKVFQLKQHYFIKDEYGQDCFEVEAKKALTLGLKLYIYDAFHREVAYIEQKLGLMGKFLVYSQGQLKAAITQKFSLMKPKFIIEQLNWTVSGNVLGRDYRIDSPQGLILVMRKKWFTWGDSYELEIVDNDDTVIALAVALAMDYMADANQ